MMNRRVRQFWIPIMVSLGGSTGSLMILQKIIHPSEAPWKHAGVPFMPYLLWAVALPLVGAATGYLSRRAGSSRGARILAALSPSILMVPVWLFILMASHRPIQWANFFFGASFWIVVPGAALIAGAWPFLRPQDSGFQEPVNTRTKTFWLPALVSLGSSMAVLAISSAVGSRSFFLSRNLTNHVVYLPWILLLPVCGALGAYLSYRAGGLPSVRLAAGMFPAIAMLTLQSLLVFTGMIVLAKPALGHALRGLTFGIVIPAAALLLGTLPFLKVRKLGT
ncbi:MAG TPA: hypothetical protein VKQ11_16735 [Candidatus Sulfotelmatobacter sp.]|nr:hypothetical protein [Candidatus Sulfotelmatobacter sp.]